MTGGEEVRPILEILFSSGRMRDFTFGFSSCCCYTILFSMYLCICLILVVFLSARSCPPSPIFY